MDLRSTLHQHLLETLEAQTHHPFTGEIDADTELVSLGLDSLGFSDLVARLEDALGYDPIALMDEPVFPRTFGELVALYRDFEQPADE